MDSSVHGIINISSTNCTKVLILVGIWFCGIITAIGKRFFQLLDNFLKLSTGQAKWKHCERQSCRVACSLVTKQGPADVDVSNIQFYQYWGFADTHKKHGLS